jgi:hypothetical protein
MGANNLQILRTSTPSLRPTGRLPGELYVNFADGAFGYVNGAGTPVDLVPQFSSQAEARAGTRTDRIMSPARVADRAGSEQRTVSTGFEQFNGIPDEANTIVISLMGLNPAVGRSAWFRFSGAGTSDQFFTARATLVNGVLPEITADAGTNICSLDNSAGAMSLAGEIQMTRHRGANRWSLQGAYRRSATVLITLGGFVVHNGAPLVGLTFQSNDPLSGRMGVSWWV